MNRCLLLLLSGLLCCMLTTGFSADVSPSGAVNSPDDHYKLGPGDKISFRILEDKDDSKMLAISDAGEVDIPYVGRMVVTGMTCKELVEKTRPILERTYYYQATVVVGIESMKKRTFGQVVVVGQIHKEGPIDISEKGTLTASKAILAAGGFADFAERRKVRVFRQLKGVDGKEVRKTFEVDMVEILEKGHAESDIILEPGDLVVVSKRLINF